MRVMLDTNVILSGLFFRGNERALLERIFRNEINGIVSETTLHECQTVIERKFDQDPNKPESLRLLALLGASVEIVKDSQAQSKLDFAKSAIRHANDAPILAAALWAEPDYFITGDNDFFKLLKSVPLKIVTTTEFLKEMSRT
ncbi:putative toxin-antitoxin system toxin component, PIN family [Candidatus Micrarchaeota archaeon]|nr:putative toxin-antitoxin system toxin component, PIN family [Candidatus Micrarchaeota archaeon]